MNAGYIPAALALFNLFYDHGENRSCPEAERVLSWLSERMDEQTPDRYRYGYYSLLNDKDKTRELALRFALDGDFGAAVRLSNHHGSASYMGSDEHVFWMTVLFLVTEHFYNQGAKHLGDRLGMKLIGERGCERDLAKIKEIYVDLMMNAPYNRRTLLSIVGALCNEGGEHLDVAERSCRRLISNGEKSNYWKLILIALLSGDRSKLESACEEACAASAVGHIGKAYLMLRHARAKA